MTSVSVYPIPYIKPQYFDGNGLPLSNGRIFTYHAGSTQAAITWATSAGDSSAENTNPIALDGSGRPPDGIYLDDVTSYRFDWFDENGNLIDTQDDIIAPFATQSGAVLTTTDQSISGVKAFNTVVGFGAGDTTEYSASDLQIVVGSTSETNVGVQLVASGPSSTAAIYFGTTEVGADSQKGYVKYDYTSDSISFGGAGSDTLILGATTADFTAPAITAGGIAVVLATDTIAIEHGGTGEVTANDALNAILPDQSASVDKFLSTDGTNTSWQTLVGGPRFLAAGQPYNFFSGTTQPSWTTFDATVAGVPLGASAVIIYAYATVNHPNSTGNPKFVCQRVDITKGNTFGTPWTDTYNVLYNYTDIAFGTTIVGSSCSQGTFPLRSDGTFDYITAGNWESGLALYIVGYYN